jgi:hypothetical protein
MALEWPWFQIDKYACDGTISAPSLPTRNAKEQYYSIRDFAVLLVQPRTVTLSAYCMQSTVPDSPRASQIEYVLAVSIRILV